MTNFERLKAMTLEELAEELCGYFGATDCTEDCPAFHECWDGHNGMLHWLAR